jgi:hypothetical protein
MPNVKSNVYQFMCPSEVSNSIPKTPTANTSANLPTLFSLASICGNS